MNEDDMMALCLAAGVRPDEILTHPELGLCLSVSGTAKLAAYAAKFQQTRERAEALTDAVKELTAQMSLGRDETRH